MTIILWKYLHERNIEQRRKFTIIFFKIVILFKTVSEEVMQLCVYNDELDTFR